MIWEASRLQVSPHTPAKQESDASMHLMHPCKTTAPATLNVCDRVSLFRSFFLFPRGQVTAPDLRPHAQFKLAAFALSPLPVRVSARPILDQTIKYGLLQGRLRGSATLLNNTSTSTTVPTQLSLSLHPSHSREFRPLPPHVITTTIMRHTPSKQSDQA